MYMKRCERSHVLLLAGLAILACGLVPQPVLAQTASVTFLNEFLDPGYINASITGVSVDGSVIVGEITLAATGEEVPFRWTADTGIVVLQSTTGAGPRGSAEGVSADGTKVAGRFNSSGLESFFWTTDTGTLGIPFLPGGSFSMGLAISADGSTVVGSSGTATGEEAYAWTESGGTVELGNFFGTDRSQAVDVSADGSVIAGWSEVIFLGFRFVSAARWTSSTYGYNLEVPDFLSTPWTCAVINSTPEKVSADGTTLMGRVTFDGDETTVFRWKTDGTIDYPVLPFSPFPYPFIEMPVAISQDGALIAFRKQIWVESTNTMVSLVDIQDALVNDFGIDMQGWDISIFPPANFNGFGDVAGIYAMSATSQDIVLVVEILLYPDHNSTTPRSLPVIIHLPYLPAGHKPTSSCSPTWESSAMGDPGLSMQAPSQNPNPSVQEDVRTFEIFDDGNGPMLYAGGIFQYAGGSLVGNGIARWNGQQWLSVGTGVTGGLLPHVNSLLTWDDGTGPALYVAGSFGIAGGMFTSNIAKWDGQQWSALGAGSTESYELNGLTAFDDGSGPALYATRPSTNNPPGEDGRVVKWDGAQWSELGVNGTSDCVLGKELVVFDDGTGPALYATFGSKGFTSLVGCQNQAPTDLSKNSLMKWDGSQWNLVGGGLIGNGVSDMVVWDDGSGPALYIMGSFFNFPGGNPALNGGSVLRWDGTSFSVVGVGNGQYFPDIGYEVGEIVDDGNGPKLLVAGANDLVQWDGQNWTPFSPFGCPSDPQGPVAAIAQYDDGLGNGIYLGGDWFEAGPELTRNIAMLRSCTPTPTGDCNADGGVDMLDYGFFSDCLSGPGGGLGTGCECSDLDADGDVDLRDFQTFMEGFTG